MHYEWEWIKKYSYLFPQKGFSTAFVCRNYIFHILSLLITLQQTYFMFSKSDIEKYFTAEKQGSLIFLIVGAFAIALALFFFFYNKTQVYKGAAIPMILIGVIFILVGFTVYRKSDDDRIRNVYAYDMKPADFKEIELPRMQKVLTDLAIYRWVEIVLFASGILIFLFLRKKPDLSFWYGLGLSLALMAILAHGLDFLVKKRAIDYTKKIESFVQSKK
jgi:drug/metabolite transporter (DMT)-like permease